MNVKLTKKHSEPFVQEILKDYNQLWEMAGPLTEELLQSYKEAYKRFKQFENEKFSDARRCGKET